MLGVKFPPVAIILIHCAPEFARYLIEWTTSSVVSDSIPNILQCPPVVVMGLPEGIRLGPGII